MSLSVYHVVKSMMEEPYKTLPPKYVHEVLEDILRTCIYWEGWITETELNTLNAYNNYLYDLYEYKEE